jgi:AraC-like DNA-binding protein
MANIDINTIKSKWRWYTSGAIVIITTLFLLTYLSFAQASAAFSESGVSLEEFQMDLAMRMFKSLLIVLALGLFWFFFAIQDYRLILNVLEKLSAHDTTKANDNTSVQPPLTLKQTGFGANDLAIIEDSVQNILLENTGYRAQISSQRDLLRENLIVRLMQGWINDVPTSLEMCKSLDLDLQGCNLQVLVFGVDEHNCQATLTDDAVLRSFQLLPHILRMMLKGIFLTYVVEIDGTVAVLVTTLPDDTLYDRRIAEDLTTIAKLVSQMVYDNTQILFRSSFGSICCGLEGIHQSFHEALETLQYTNLVGGKGNALRYQILDSASRDYATMNTLLKQEMQFINCIDSLDYQNACRIFLEMCDSWNNLQVPSLEHIHYYMQSLTNNMITALDKIQLFLGDDTIDYMEARESILSSKSLPELKQIASGVFEQVNYYSLIKKKQSSQERIMKIIDYINHNFHDSNLSVAQIATKFDLNPSYLSRTFKKCIGTGIAEYLQHIRIEAAKALLSQGDISVKKAADKVGFNNVVTMNRAFKKHEGTTAGRLRHH